MLSILSGVHTVCGSECVASCWYNITIPTCIVIMFYGRKFALFKSKEGEEKGLGEILGGGEVGERETVLEHMREALAKLLDK